MLTTYKLLIYLEEILCNFNIGSIIIITFALGLL